MAISASIIGSMILANASSGITPSIIMSRPDDGLSNPSMWVAPCAVTLSGKLTTKNGELNPFRNLHFSWDYGDGTKANEYWLYGARPGALSKNRDIGPIAGHVYDTPGTYYVTLTVTAADGKVNAIRQKIVVTDPDVVFSGANTICISADGDFTDAPAGAQQITSSDFSAAMNTYIAAGKRLMFRNGRTYTAATAITEKTNISNVQIAPFGPGTPYEIQTTNILAATLIPLRDNNGVFDNWQIWGGKATNPNGLSPGTNGSALRFLSSNFQSSTNTINSTTGHVTVYKFDTDQLVPFNINGYGHAIVECSGHNIAVTPGAVGLGANGIFASNMGMFLNYGNNIDNLETAEHVCRIQGFRNIAVKHNKFLNPGGTKHCIALRGGGVTNVPVAWAANTVKNVGDIVQPTVPNDCAYRVYSRTGDFKTGATEPTWPTNVGDEVVSGNVTLKCEFNTSASGKFNYVANYASVNDNYMEVTRTTLDYDITLIAQIAPNAVSAYEPIEDVVWENNYIAPNLSTKTPLVSHYGLSVQGNRIAVRNNIINASNTGFSFSVFQVRGVNSGGSPACNDVLIENISVYSAHDRTVLIDKADAGQVGINIKNTIVYAPNSGANATIGPVDPEFIFTNCSTLTQMKTVNPGYAVVPPVTADDFKVASGYGVGAGSASDGLFLDYFGTTRSRLANPDMGAIDSLS